MMGNAIYLFRRKLTFLSLVMLVAGKAFGQGGPPLVTDDPGTPGNGHWEVNAVAQWSISDQTKALQLPLFDINYGYGDHIQLNLNTSYITVNQSDAGQTSGLSLASLAVKWRFVDEQVSGVAISTYPRIDFHHGLASNDAAINAPGTRYFLPLEFSKEFGAVGVNPEIGYATYTQLPSEWVCGIAISYAFEKEKEALIEIHGRSVVGASDRELLYNIGTRYLVAENVSVIATVGRTFVAYTDSSTTLNFYAGVQIRL